MNVHNYSLRQQCIFRTSSGYGNGCRINEEGIESSNEGLAAKEKGEKLVLALIVMIQTIPSLRSDRASKEKCSSHLQREHEVVKREQSAANKSGSSQDNGH